MRAEIDWDEVTNITLLVGAIVLVITGNEGWAAVAAVAWWVR